MNKLTAFILFLTLILAVPFCAQAEEANITGTWYSDMYINVLTMQINDGGIYNMELMDEAMIGTWTLEGDTLYLDKGTAGETAINYDAETQTIGQNGFVFTQKKVKNFKPGKTAKANAEDFTGSWTATKVEPAAAALPLNIDGLYMNAEIDGAHVVLTETAAKVIREGEAVFADHTLQLTVPAADESGKDNVYTIVLMKNGMIRITTDSAKYYLEKTEA